MEMEIIPKSNGGSAFLFFFNYVNALNAYNNHILHNRNYLCECEKLDKFISKVKDDEFLAVYKDLPGTAGLAIVKDGEIIDTHVILESC